MRSTHNLLITLLFLHGAACDPMEGNPVDLGVPEPEQSLCVPYHELAPEDTLVLVGDNCPHRPVPNEFRDPQGRERLGARTAHLQSPLCPEPFPATGSPVPSVSFRADDTLLAHCGNLLVGRIVGDNEQAKRLSDGTERFVACVDGIVVDVRELMVLPDGTYTYNFDGECNQ